MKVLPELNLNKHPQECVNGGLIGAENIVVSKDNSVIQTEPMLENSICTQLLDSYFGNNTYSIKHIISCNKELVLFVLKNDSINYIDVIRYDETTKTIDVTGAKLEYHGGNFIGTFTYNNNNLIIAFTEINCKDDVKIPLRTIELGKFNIREFNGHIHEMTPIALQPVCPEVIIPNVESEELTGYTSYKGFYYIFVRFKISDNNYTQWFNTNHSHLLDESNNDFYFELKGPNINNSSQDADDVEMYTSSAFTGMSNKDDFCAKTLKLIYKYDGTFSTINGRNNFPEYKYMQFAYVIVRKSFFKTYRTNDIEFNNVSNEHILNPKQDIEISIDDVLTNYYNYYDVKTIENHNNKLYIANYSEDVSKIDLQKDYLNNPLNQLAVDISVAEDPEIIPPEEEEPSEENLAYRYRLDLIHTHRTYDNNGENVIETEKYIGEVPAYKDGYGSYAEYYYTMQHCFAFCFGTAKDDYYRIGDEVTQKSMTTNNSAGGNQVRIGSYTYGMSLLDIDRSNPNDYIYYPEVREYSDDEFLLKYPYADGGEQDARMFYWNCKAEKYSTEDSTYDVFSPKFKDLYIKNHKPKNIRIYPEQEYIIDKDFIAQISSSSDILNFVSQVTIKPQKVRGGVKIEEDNGKLSTIYDIKQSYMFNGVNYEFSKYGESYNLERTVSATGVFLEDYRRKHPETSNENYDTYVALITGDNSLNRSLRNANPFSHRWTLECYDKTTGKIIWKRVNGKFVSLENTVEETKANTYNIQNKSNNSVTTIGKCTSSDGATNMPYNYYNFFVHFVDKYGISTNGYNISYLNPTNNDENFKLYHNSLNNSIIKIGADNDIKFKLNRLPKNYYGYYFSYEKPEFERVYFCHTKLVEQKASPSNIIRCYSGEFDLLDKIDWSFDSIAFIKGVNVEHFPDEGFVGGTTGFDTKYYLNQKLGSKLDYSIISIRKIKTKKILPADSAENMGQQSCIQIEIEGAGLNTDVSYFAYLIKTTKSFDSEGVYLDIYNNPNKTLIPCSPICYDLENYVAINTKTAFFTNIYYLSYKKNTLFNTVLNQFNVEGKTDIVKEPMYHREWEYYRPNQLNYKRYNNEPEIIVVAINGLSTTDVNNKTFARGKIVQIQNSIDLFEYPHFTYFDGHPKSLDWYNPTIAFETIFPKTIRRSKVIQDESHTNAWRQFPVEQYKIINENKGNIIKLISAGSQMLIHTEHSLFVFSGVDALKSNNSNQGVQLFSVDVWDINYKELLSSVFGKAGLFKENHSIIGEYGYVWYDADTRRIYKYDNNQFSTIDENIKNFINKLVNYEVNIVEDYDHCRLLFNFVKDDKSFVLSYNYSLNRFTSLHTYKFDEGFNTKNNFYLLQNGNKLVNFDLSNKYSKGMIKVVCNENFFTMKTLEYITYNVKQIVSNIIDDFSPVEELNTYYRGDVLRIYNDLFDTKEIDISGGEHNTINEDYDKPYWRFGNWRFNYFRNKYNPTNDEEVDSLCYGNYFIINFVFDTDKQVEIENIDVIYSNGELR